MHTFLSSHKFLNKPESTELIEKYEKISRKDPEGCGYSALQYAAYFEDLAAVIALIEKAELDNNLLKTFLFQNDVTKERILHVAMKNIEIFKYICTKVMEIQDLFAVLLTTPDIDGDIILHQIVEFGRIEALVYLNALDHPGLRILIYCKNNENLTPWDLVENFETCKTIQNLITGDILNEGKLAHAKEQLPRIRELLKSIAPQNVAVVTEERRPSF